MALALIDVPIFLHHIFEKFYTLQIFIANGVVIVIVIMTAGGRFGSIVFGAVSCHQYFLC